jgi:trehalose/maltose hydrolase-like predicted phosphorylase
VTLDSGSNCLSSSVLSTNVSTTSQCYRLSSVPSTIDVVKWVGIASSDAYPAVELETALRAISSATESGWDAVLSNHQEAWGQIWEDGDIEIPGSENEELQLATRASLFHILSNVRLSFPLFSPSFEPI